MPTLFDPPATPNDHDSARPLADRMRPRTLDEIVGQDSVVGDHGFLRRAIAEDRVPSIILWGPPGSGKTTIARIIARETSSSFVPFSAVTSGIKEVKSVMVDAARMRRAQGRRTLVFIDEIHRFNRAQQDAFLPYVESGDIVLIGATTENPSFQVISALLSRSKVIVLDALELPALRTVLDRALSDVDRGLGTLDISVTSEALDTIAQLASGDARRALNLLELAVADARARDTDRVGPRAVTALAQRKVLLYDRDGEEHFNLISALHKSLRESDPDASIYWLARMLAAGEEPLYVARRLIRFASEDIGLADPWALGLALAARDAYHGLGSPEGELALAQAVVYLALAPKSNAMYRAYGAARRAVEESPAEPPPMAIRNAPTELMRDLGYGQGYIYAHDTVEGVGGLQCLPDAIAERRFYEPKGEGFEQELAKRLERFRRLRRRAAEASRDG